MCCCGWLDISPTTATCPHTTSHLDCVAGGVQAVITDKEVVLPLIQDNIAANGLTDEARCQGGGSAQVRGRAGGGGGGCHRGGDGWMCAA
jgi:hypothetical protein